MILRPYQERLVGNAVKALKKYRNTLAVAATGAGKTICLAAIAKEIGGKQLILQHRQELVQQNLLKYRAINPQASCSLWTADTKSFVGDATFAMVQSLCGHTDKMPKFDLIIADEAHHCVAPTWSKIIQAAKEKNPDVMVAGFTATPSRSDRKGLRRFFDNICDQVSIRELVRLGFLVPPKAWVIDTAGTREVLESIQASSEFGEQAEVASVLDTDIVNAEVIRHWRERAEGRPTVAFCSTVAHAEHVAECFSAAGIPAVCVHGALSPGVRSAYLDKMTQGKVKVITNCMVLTEGWDYPPVSTIILLRRCSDKSPLIQMVGRGLRVVSQSDYPGVKKTDCIVMDFGYSLLTHGDIFADITLGSEGEEEHIKDNATKTCPDCEADLPVRTRVCPFCGHVFGEMGINDSITSVELTEMDILNHSPFRYVDIFGSGRVMIASGFDAWVAVCSPDDGAWYALGKPRQGRLESLYLGDRIQAISAADDFMRQRETSDSAKKSRRWLNDVASAKQVALLNNFGYNLHPDVLGYTGMTKYEAVCHTNFQFHIHQIEKAMGIV